MKRFLTLLKIEIFAFIVIFILKDFQKKKTQFSMNKDYLKNQSNSDKVLKFSKKYALNKEFMINNNLAQYSSYLIVDQDELTKKRIYRIEVFVHFNYKFIKDFGEKENFTCVLKLLSSGKRQQDILMELEAIDSPKFYWKDNKKLIYNLDLDFTKKINNSSDSILKNIVVAVIWKYDFEKTLDISNVSISNHTVLPYSLIKFQIPSIIISQIPRLKKVGFCIPYTYSIPSNLEYWTNLHLSFGISELMMYDSVGTNLTKYLKTIHGDNKRITVNTFNIEFNDLCNKTSLLRQFEGMNVTDQIKEYFIKSCNDMYELEFHKKITWRTQFEQLTSNDCFTVMKEKYEFIGYYDLDEFVFPRTTDYSKDFNSNNSNYFSCSSFDTICSYEPFKITNKETDNNDYYLYLQSLITKNKNGRDMNKLGSISFNHAIYLIPDHHQKKLFNDLGSVIEKIELKNSNASAFPLSISLSSPPFKAGHTFSIRKEDFDYIKYLHNSYNSLIPCLNRNYFKNFTNINKNFVRYIYYLTEENERMGKAIHYYKNIKSLFVHYAQDAIKDHWSFTAPELQGHIVSHFRRDAAEIYSKSFQGSIRKLNIDFEYIFFILKNYTMFCEI